jgi:signal transduction histidine kinase
MYVKIPQQLRNIIKDSLRRNSEILTKEEINLLFEKPNIKILFSIRSDRMSFLDRMTDYVPGILKKCYELQPLDEIRMMQAIVIPAKLRNEKFLTKPFKYSDASLLEIHRFLSKNGKQPIETFLLQVLCQYIEKIVLKTNISVVSVGDLGDLEYISNNFYDSIINDLPDKEREAARLLIEDGLIFEEEERRLSVYEGQVIKQFKVSKELLRKLVDSHLLRSEPYYSGGFLYEISHDALVHAILTFKRERVRIQEERNTALKQLEEDRKREEEARYQFALQRAEESDRLQTALLANMSHEVRTPLNGILGFVEILLSEDLQGEEKMQYLKIIQSSAFRINKIINDIWTMSSIESAQETIRRERFNLNKILDYIYSLFSTKASDKNLKFIMKTPFNEELSVIYSDKDKMISIIEKLVENAINFTITGYVEFGYHLKGEFLEFYISDSGIGIKKEIQQNIFERFIQGENGYNRRYEGSGLGLPISKAFVELLGGKIWVESELNKGSTFYFTIPYEK